MNRRTLLLAVGVAAAALGLVIAFVPTLAASVQVWADAPAALAVLAIVAGLQRARSFVRSDAGGHSFPPREVGRPIAVPGGEFDRLIERVPRTSVAGDQRSLKARDDLRKAAVAVLTRHRGLSVEEAEAAVDAGEWTDDRLAAEFFTSLDGSGDSVRETLAGSLVGESPFHRRARHAAREIHRLTRGEES